MCVDSQILLYFRVLIHLSFMSSRGNALWAVGSGSVIDTCGPQSYYNLVALTFLLKVLDVEIVGPQAAPWFVFGRPYGFAR